MKKTLFIFALFFVYNSCFAGWFEEGTKFFVYDGKNRVIACKYSMSGDVVIREMSVYFVITDFSQDSFEEVGLFRWSLSEDSVDVKSSADIPVDGQFHNGLLSFFDGNNKIYTIDVDNYEMLWHGKSQLPIAGIALSDSLIYIAKKNGELVISNNLTGNNIKRITNFTSSIKAIKVNPVNNLLAIINTENMAFIYSKDSLSITDSIANCKELNLYSKNEVICASKEDLLFLYDLNDNKIVTKYIYDKPEETSIISIVSCNDNYFAIELAGVANTIKVINKFSGATVKDILKDKSKIWNYRGGCLLGYYNNNIVTNIGCVKVKGSSRYNIPCRHDLSDIISFEQDVISPDISIIIPENLTESIAISDDFVFIKGRAVDSSEIKSVTINGSEVPFLPKTGEFNGYVKLDTGYNKIRIVATDYYNNRSENQVIILKTNQSNRDAIVVGNQTSYDKILSYTYHAIIIAEQDYLDDKIKDLTNPILDATNLKDILTKYYTFDDKNIQLKINPTRNEIIKSLEDVLLGLGPDDHLLLFYAGHGIYDEKLKRGYWLPSDANLDNKGTWVSNNDIRDYIAGIESKHTLLVTDACFGGSIFDYNRDVNIDPQKVVSKLLEKKSRTAMTSGLDNVVPDKSVFFQYFLKYLIENPNQYVTANEIFNELYKAVISNTRNIPQYGVIKDTNHEGGEFIFLRKK